MERKVWSGEYRVWCGSVVDLYQVRRVNCGVWSAKWQSVERKACFLKSRNTMKSMKCCTCHAAWRYPKCCACHNECNSSSANDAKAARLPHKATLDTSGHMKMPGSSPATQNEITTCFATLKKESFCSFPHRHGDGRRKPNTRDKTTWEPHRTTCRARLSHFSHFAASNRCFPTSILRT